jgi:hypothetical protein
MDEFDVSEEELRVHSNDSLIRYIGALQAVLRLKFDKQLPVPESEVTEKVALSED